MNDHADVVRRAIKDKAHGQYDPPSHPEERLAYDDVFKLVEEWEAEHPRVTKSR